MKDMDVTISAIIPSYNAGRFIGEAIQSVLEQSYAPQEIIVMDDGSTDDTREIVAQFGSRVDYHCQKNSGTSNARNRAIELSRGNFLAFLDADDLWQSAKLEKQMSAFQEMPYLDIVYTQVENFLSPDAKNKENVKRLAEPISGYIPSSAVIRRDSFFRVGLFSTQYQIGEFVDWYVRANECKLKEHVVPEVLVKRRIHTTNKGIVLRENQKEMLKILAAKLKRQRKTE